MMNEDFGYDETKNKFYFSGPENDWLQRGPDSGYDLEDIDDIRIHFR